MGVFSEINIEANTDMAEAVSKRPDDSEILAKAEERDDARQQAEADAAQTALAQLAETECESAPWNLRKTVRQKNGRPTKKPKRNVRRSGKPKRKRARRKSFLHGNLPSAFDLVIFIIKGILR